MRVHGIQLRGLTSPTGDHQLGLDPGYTVLRLSDPSAARKLVAIARGLLHPESERAAKLESQGRAVLTLALRSDACLIAADFARGRLSLGRHEVRGAGYKSLSSDPHEIEEYLLAVGLPPADEFDRLHVFGVATPAAERSRDGGSDALLPARRVPLEAPRPAPDPRPIAAVDARVARRAEERARRVAAHEEAVLALASERARLEKALEDALASAAAERSRGDGELRTLRALDDELTQLEREHKTTLGELEKNAALADTVEDFDVRLAQFRSLGAARDEERAVIEDQRHDLLAERARLRLAPRRQLVPIALGLALGAAGGAAGAVGYAAAYWLAGAGISVLLVALGATRLARSQLGRVETLLATLRVRERTAERRFETDGGPIRSIMLSLGVDSLDALSAAARRFAEQLERAEEQKRRLEVLASRYPAADREKLARLEQARGAPETNPAVRAARDALLALPADVPPLPADSVFESEEPASPSGPDEAVAVEADTAVELDEKPDEEPEPERDTAISTPGPEALVSSAARVLGRSESEVRARLGPVLPVYLRALSAGIFTNARAADTGIWMLRGSGREEQPFTALPARERELVHLAVQLALLESLATDRRVPLLVGPDLPVRDDAERRALARAFKRLASVVQVIQVVTVSDPWAEHAGKSFAL
jgi:hypothetical protein